MRFLYSYLFLLFVLLSCTKKILYQTLVNEKKIVAISDYNNFEYFYISEHGCLTCLNKYLTFIVDNKLNKENTVIVCSATGMKLDISGLQSDTIKNVVFTESTNTSKYFSTEYPVYAKIVENRIDTSIIIDPNTVNETVEYLSRK